MNPTLQKYLDEFTDYNIGYKTRQALVVGILLTKYEKEITAFHEACPDERLSIDINSIELHSANREVVSTFLKSFGGKWKKSLEDYYPDRIRYDQESEHPTLLGMKLFISVRNTPPPPSCKIVEYEEEVPAHKVKRKKIECPKDENLEDVTATPAVLPEKDEDEEARLQQEQEVKNAD